MKGYTNGRNGGNGGGGPGSKDKTLYIYTTNPANSSSFIYKDAGASTVTSASKSVAPKEKASNGLDIDWAEAMASKTYTPPDETYSLILNLGDYNKIVFWAGVCLAAGTRILISLDGQTTPIERIRPGDTVVAYDPDTKKNVLKIVTNTVDHQIEHINHVHFENGVSLDISDGHPICTTEGWRTINVGAVDPESMTEPVNELEVGNMAVLSDGSTTEVVSIERDEDISISVYNFSVEDLHTYYANMIRVHNATVSAL